QDLVAAALVGGQAERHGTVLPGRRAEAVDAFQAPAAALGLSAVGARDVPPDEVLLGREAAGLLREGALLRQPALRALAQERFVVTRVAHPRARLEVQDVVHHGLEKGAVVAD